MKSYLFLVRPWNVDFFLNLKEKLIIDNEHSDFLFLTMHYEAEEALLDMHQDVVYLPKEMEKNNGMNAGLLNEFDAWMFQKYGYGMNYLYETERFKPNDKPEEFIAKHFEILYKYINKGYDLVSLTLDHFVYMLAGYINDFRGGKNFYLQPVGFPNNACLIFTNPWQIKPIVKIEDDNSILQDYINNIHLPPQEVIHYMKPEEIIKKNTLDKIKYRFLLYKRWLATKKLKGEFHYMEGIEPFPFFRKGATINRSKYTYRSLNSIIETNKGKRFYYPLQFEPEMSILAYSPYYKSQIETIRLIAMHLSLEDILILKENPKMLGQRSKAFYDEIAKFPNVIWVDPSENSRTIIKNSFKVISITGTACIEAACMGVNSLLLGYPPFKSLIKTPILSDSTISDFRTILYSSYSSNDIKETFITQWEAYNKSVVIVNLIPKFNGEKIVLPNFEEKATIIKQILQ